MSWSSQGFHLPEDIVLIILCRLPVKSLIRFSSVSKRWRFIIIHDPQFAKSHLQLALEQRSLTQRLFVSNYPRVFEDTPQFKFKSWEDSLSGSVIDLTSPSEEQNQRVLTSCNGLVLVGESYIADLVRFFIWNPSNGFSRKIPSPRMTERHPKLVVCGFGYVSATDDYKLVFVIPGDRTHYLLVYIFSLKANCWRVIKAPCLSSSSPRWCNYEVGTFSNGAIHWINRSDRESIYAFDLAEEVFREIPMPAGWLLIDSSHVRVLSGGCLCVGLQNGRSWEIWGMTEYAVPESWVKLFGFEEFDIPDVFASRGYGWLGDNWDLCFVTEGGTVVIKLSDPDEMVRIECRKDEKPVCSGRYLLEKVPGVRHCIFWNSTIYVETLVSVPE